MGPEINLRSYYEKLENSTSIPVVMKGRVKRITGMIVEATLPNARIGEICVIEPKGRPLVKAQVVGFNDEDVFHTNPLANSKNRERHCAVSEDCLS